eukprot:Nitzschia sp. Nitz4//scaffold191_size41780//36734//38362//NITZ4_007477-RA/size41780-processed-gene-0.39-mRNA-1//1//CDS//3329540211//6307//frame0
MRDLDDDEGHIISKPHNHDVLCGRGGLTNQHAGNEWFRRLVRSNRALYRSCPKHTKLLVAKAIVQAVQQQEPPGRFLEVADKDAGTWRQINYKRSVDKTSQALREKEQQPQQPQSSPVDPLESEVAQLAAQAAAKKGKKQSTDLSDLAQATLRQAGLEANNGGSSNQQQSNDQQGKRKASGMGDYPMSAFWDQGGQGGPSADSNEFGARQKRSRTDPDEAAPLPTLQTRQSSTFFRFLSSSGIFGSSNKNEQGNNYVDPMRQQSSGFFSYGGGNNDMRQPNLRPNPSDLISMEASHFEGGNISMGGGNQRQSLNNFDPLPVNSVSQGGGGIMQGQFTPEASRMNNGMQEQYYPNMAMTQGPRDSMAGQQMGDAVPPPSNRLTSQVSDWLGSFWPLGRDGQARPNPQDQENFQPPPPPEGNLERRASSSIFNLARSPSQFLTSLRSGVSSMFGGDDLTPVPVNQMNGRVPEATPAAPIIGTATTSKPDSLLDDYEETPLETRLRSVTSIKPPQQYDV